METSVCVFTYTCLWAHVGSQVRNALQRVSFTIVSVKGWFSNEDTPGQLRTTYWGQRKDGQNVMKRQQDDKKEGLM